jgi:hypothetical protein
VETESASGAWRPIHWLKRYGRIYFKRAALPNVVVLPNDHFLVLWADSSGSHRHSTPIMASVGSTNASTWTRARALTPNLLLNWWLAQSADHKARIGWIAARSNVLHVLESSNGRGWHHLPAVTLAGMAGGPQMTGADPNQLVGDSGGDTFAVWEKPRHQLGGTSIAKGGTSWQTIQGTVSGVLQFQTFPIPGGVLIATRGLSGITIYSATRTNPTWHKEASFPIDPSADNVYLGATDVANDGRTALGYNGDDGDAYLALRSASGTWSGPISVPKAWEVVGTRFIPGGIAVVGVGNAGGVYADTFSPQGALESSASFSSGDQEPVLPADPFGTFNYTTSLSSPPGFVSAAEPSQMVPEWLFATLHTVKALSWTTAAAGPQVDQVWKCACQLDFGSSTTAAASRSHSVLASETFTRKPTLHFFSKG